MREVRLHEYLKNLFTQTWYLLNCLCLKSHLLPSLVKIQYLVTVLRQKGRKCINKRLKRKEWIRYFYNLAVFGQGESPHTMQFCLTALPLKSTGLGWSRDACLSNPLPPFTATFYVTMNSCGILIKLQLRELDRNMSLTVSPHALILLF